uniref:Chromo domain-containing protein n=1 Tax=Syphacia muris TaxID=451379 RepID=A0A0N5AER9_9BILA
MVEKIVAYRINDGKEFYKVRWAGFTEEDDTWEPYENLNEACRLMIKDMFGHFPGSSGNVTGRTVSFSAIPLENKTHSSKRSVRKNKVFLENFQEKFALSVAYACVSTDFKNFLLISF